MFTKSQLIRVLKESKSSIYLDYLLDNIDHLTPEEQHDLELISKTGRQIEKPVPKKTSNTSSQYVEPAYDDKGEEDLMDPEEELDLCDMFMKELNIDIYIAVDDVDWKLSKTKGKASNNLYLKVTGEDKVFRIKPFWESNEIRIELPNGGGFGMTLREPPGDQKEMKLFVDTFLRNIFPTVVKKVKKL